MTLGRNWCNALTPAYPPSLTVEATEQSRWKCRPWTWTSWVQMLAFHMYLSKSQLSSGASDGNNSLQPVGRIKRVHILRHFKQFWAQMKHSVHDNYCCYCCYLCVLHHRHCLLLYPPQGCLLQLQRIVCNSSNASEARRVEGPSCPWSTSCHVSDLKLQSWLSCVQYKWRMA